MSDHWIAVTSTACGNGQALTEAARLVGDTAKARGEDPGALCDRLLVAMPVLFATWKNAPNRSLDAFAKNFQAIVDHLDGKPAAKREGIQARPVRGAAPVGDFSNVTESRTYTGDDLRRLVKGTS